MSRAAVSHRNFNYVNDVQVSIEVYALQRHKFQGMSKPYALWRHELPIPRLDFYVEHVVPCLSKAYASIIPYVRLESIKIFKNLPRIYHDTANKLFKSQDLVSIYKESCKTLQASRIYS